MAKPDCMKTHSQFLAAEHMSRVLLMKHAQESSGGPLVIYGDIQVEEAFQTLADRLGYRVFRVVPEISPTREPTAQAAE